MTLFTTTTATLLVLLIGAAEHTLAFTAHKQPLLFAVPQRGKTTTPSHIVLSSAAAATVNGDAVSDTKEEEDDDDGALNIDTIRLNIYEKARTVTCACTSGTLCTMSAEQGIQGAPFGSFVDYVLDDDGNPVLLMNEMSMHTINIQKASELASSDDGDDSSTAADAASAMVTLFTQLGGNQADAASKGLQDVSRCSLTGVLSKIPDTDEDLEILRMRYSLAHAYADQVMDSPKFAFYRLEPRKIYFVGGFGVLAKWVDPQDYGNAAPDILAVEAPVIVERINRDHNEDLQLTARHLLDVAQQVEQIRVTNVDRLGMDIRVTSQKGTRRNKLQTDEFRIGFRIPVISVEDAKSEILKVFQEAWEKGNGVTWGDEEAPGSSVPIIKIAADSLE